MKYFNMRKLTMVGVDYERERVKSKNYGKKIDFASWARSHDYGP